MSSVLVREVTLGDGDGLGDTAVDVVIDGDRISRIEPPGTTPIGQVERVIAGDERLLLPGFVDAHSHADGRIFDPEVQLALLRQGVTSIITGQDGVSYAPGDGAYATEYFAAINGRHPSYVGGGIGAVLAAYDGATPLNAATLVPAGTVRHEVCGRSTDAAAPAQLAAMRRLVADGLAAGAVGLSTGLDYVPGIFADTDELARLSEPVAAAGAVHVSHLRGGYEVNSSAGVGELAEIARRSGARVHVSHFHAEPGIVHELLQGLAESEIDATFDAYPYTRGCSLLAMPILPPALSVRPVSEVLAALTDPVERSRLLVEWFPTIADYPSLGPDWPGMLTFAHVGADEYAWTHGLTLEAAARRSGSTPAEFTLDVLVAARLEVGVVMAVPSERTPEALSSILSHPRALGGSDGIFVGAHPHPRARGSFARYLRELVLDRAVLGWGDAAALVSTRAVERFGLGDRGRVRPGRIADLVLVDPVRVRDRANYDEPMRLSEGIDDVLVAGVPVLAAGALTGATPGRGIRRSTARRRGGHSLARAARPEEA